MGDESRTSALQWEMAVVGEEEIQGVDEPTLAWGTVVDALTGQPVAGVTIDVKPQETAGLPGQTGGEVAAGGASEEEEEKELSAESAQDGGFSLSLDDLLHGPASLVLELEANGYASKSVEVELGPWLRGERELVIELDPLARILGQVVDSKGRPVTEAEVKWISGATGHLPPPGEEVTPDEATTNEQGEYVLEGIPSGEIVLFARDQNYEELAVQRVQVAPGQTLRVELQTAVIPMPRIDLRVVDRRGEELSFVTVQVEPQGPISDLQRVLALNHQWQDSGVSGRLELEVASVGWYLVRAYHSSVVVGEARAFAEAMPSETVIQVEGRLISCSLRGADDRVQAFNSYSIHTSLPCEHNTSLGEMSSGRGVCEVCCTRMGRGGAGFGKQQRLRFLWPADRAAVTVSLQGEQGSGELHLERADQPCQIPLTHGGGSGS